MFDLGIFCHLLRLMGIYGWGPRPGILKVSFSLFFSFFLLFFIFSLSLSPSLSLSLPLSLSLSLSLSHSLSLSLTLSLSLSLSLSGAPLAPGPLDIVHPCHPVATPLRTGDNTWMNTQVK